MKKKLGHYAFEFSILQIIILFALLSFLISLGVWQLNRAEEKKALLELEAGRQQGQILELTYTAEDDIEALRYREVEISGKYDFKHQFLIDNQVVEGKPGYFVMTPFILSGSTKAVLVNRGWVPLNLDRSVMPDVAFTTAAEVIKGRINNFPSVGYKLPGAEIPTEGWPSIVQLVDTFVLEKKLGYPLFGFQVQLNADEANGYTRKWKTTGAIMTPERHVAYALQWFGLAVTLVILMIWLSIKKAENE
jgi:surfeit locus 1 family protein